MKKLYRVHVEFTSYAFAATSIEARRFAREMASDIGLEAHADAEEVLHEHTIDPDCEPIDAVYGTDNKGNWLTVREAWPPPDDSGPPPPPGELFPNLKPIG